ncbi:tetratricopeptide repeat protein [Luteimonas sp. RC10]|uniref:tetratricopeptide repeat protein n=1 Tax=Luteimonas sp. RC10 TaxID=2587035 RepID=UPI001621A36A|nr:tetratricopeptide repeat protein [Luteimonas sp. RC10]MBB3345127.1 Ca-activated chloride channel family protein [Luteimonas sp. RC10]
MSGGWPDVVFARPAWLWALLVLPLLAGIWWVRRRGEDAWRQAVDPHLLPHLLERRPGGRGLLALAAWLCAGLLAVLALAGPGWRQVDVPLASVDATPLVVALDLSSATTATDLPPSRLLQARAKLARLLALHQGPVALLAYADDAYTVAPLTDDAANVALYLDALAPDIMPVDGQRADRAIEQATRLLRQGDALRGEIVLLTDGADRAAVREAAAAARMGYRVSVLGLGSADGAAYRDRDGALRHARLDAAALQALATAGGGRWHPLSADDGDLDALGLRAARAGGAGAAADGDAQTRRIADQGYWLLLPLLALVLLAFRRGAAVAVLAVVLVWPILPAQAAQPPVGTPWRRADQIAHAQLEQGAAAYRDGRHEDALRAWTGLPGADAAYNRGNALARLGRFDEAIAAYDEALRLQPDMADAQANRAAVDAARRRQPPPGPRDDPRAPPRDQQRQSGRPDPGDGRTGDRGAPQPAPSSDGAPRPDTPPAPPDAVPPTDEAAQQRTDQAMRERMQQALDDAGEGSQTPGDVTPADRQDADTRREREQANQAWLRRVPDDPGGLLRAQFRIEHERRHGAEALR